MLDRSKDIFRALHENKWLAIEYRNRQNEITKYWIALEGIDLKKKTLLVQGLHLGKLTLARLTIAFESIVSSKVIEGSYHFTDPALIADIQHNEHRYQELFGPLANLKILSYLEDCNCLDTTPYCRDFALIKHLDGDSFDGGKTTLSAEQFKALVQDLSKRTPLDTRTKGQSAAASANTQQNLRLEQLALNLLSINTKKGLFVLAYKPLYLDVEKRVLVAGGAVVCSEFKVFNNEVQQVLRIRQYLEGSDLKLLNDFEAHAEDIKDLLAKHDRALSVDDRPYLMQVCFDNIIDLRKEYAGIHELYEQDETPLPLKAFFGELVARPVRRKELDLVLLDKKIDLDQILAINKAIKYPLAYIQGPPGTGKTSTIINTIINAFFHGRTVLFASNNNHPIDGVAESLASIKHRNRAIPLPVIRLGGYKEQCAALDYIREIREQVAAIQVYDKALDHKKVAQSHKARELTALLARYEERLDLLERQECIETLLESSKNLNFTAELEARQLRQITARLGELGSIELADALPLIANDRDELSMYLYYASVKHIKRLSEPKYQELLELAYDTESTTEARAKAFNTWLASPDNLRSFLRVFPLVITTCISARRLGEPKPSFDMVILDEASQCNIATALVPIVRGDNLMLVGDPQQLNPVVSLDPLVSERLRNNYRVPERYDYACNSLYKAFLASDSVSDEILLSHHYRCDARIIEFSNKKYYRSKLKIQTERRTEESLVYYNVSLAPGMVRNTAPAEVDAILDYLRKHPGENVGIITPFTNQRDLIQQALERQGFTERASVGTVHAFQGDEQDTIIFASGLSSNTSSKTYAWLAGNRELINVATSRAKKKLVVLSNKQNLKRLHELTQGQIEISDDLYELVSYVSSQGESKVTEQSSTSRALGVKPYSTEAESAFLESLDHALGNLFVSGARFVVHKEVPVSQVFQNNITGSHLFYTGRFDFVIYERLTPEKETPVFAIELDGKEHYELEEIKRRDREKQSICSKHGMTLIRVDNSYARRYHYIKNILAEYFGG